jgi:hypothetical protein
MITDEKMVLSLALMEGNAAHDEQQEQGQQIGPSLSLQNI